MTTDQICKLFWRNITGGVGPRKACERRLRKLRGQQIIRAIEQPVTRAEASKPYIYALDQQGATLISTELGVDPKEIDWRPKRAEANYPFLTHLLRTNDVHIAVVLACRQLRLTLVEWLDEKTLKSEGMKDVVTLQSPDGRRYRAAVVPDASFVIQRGETKARFFVEIDESTVTVSPSRWERRGWARKVRVYETYFNSEAYQNRYGGRPARVLTVTTGSQRLYHLKAVTEREGGSSRFLFATSADATDADKLLTAKIWHQAGATECVALLG